jgi:hypothetical protein
MWPQYGLGGLSPPANPPILFKKMVVAGLHREGGFWPCRGVDICALGPIYNR